LTLRLLTDHDKYHLTGCLGWSKILLIVSKKSAKVVSMTSLTLDQLEIGKQAIVTRLTCSGANRRRLMDLGILPGTRLQAELKSPLGDPIAYRVRDALIALRRDQARQIEIELPQGDQS
jgi:Fe2+ transport system protein FeoA